MSTSFYSHTPGGGRIDLIDRNSNKRKTRQLFGDIADALVSSSAGFGYLGLARATATTRSVIDLQDTVVHVLLPTRSGLPMDLRRILL